MNPHVNPIETECLVIGSGIAGLSAALVLTQAGKDTLVITAASSLEISNTSLAQGGIIYRSDDNDKKQLAEDIARAGCFSNYLPAVEQLVTLGPRFVEEILIEKIRVKFDCDQNGKLHLTKEGGHIAPRIVHTGDESGDSIETALLEYVKKSPHVRFLPRTTAVNLLMTSFHHKDRSKLHDEAKCFGAFAFDQQTGEVFPIFSKHTVLATGGLGQLYLHHTNSDFARGDGIALAHRVGCRLENLEYVQFHPTTLYSTEGPRLLITEALRGEGAILLNHAGERFLKTRLPGESHPELAPRDRVTKAIHEEMLSNNHPCVYLDISHKNAKWIKDRFPLVYRNCKQFGIDITERSIPVVPAAHYLCGGIWTDLNGRTTIPNLWAVGEVASTGLHGANRLASTSLLEGLVWGTQAGRAISQLLNEESHMDMVEIDQWEPQTTEIDPAFLAQDWQTLKHTMWNYVGIIKTDARLNRAMGILTELARGIEVFYRKAKLSDTLIGLRHASLVARLILKACQHNDKSLGCYVRT